MGVTRPPLEYLASCSKVSLESFELARLNEASNYRKEVQQILQGWIDTEVDARLARWILESKQAQADHRDGRRAAIAQPVLPLLDPSFLPLDEARAAESELQEKPREVNRRALRQREPEVLPSAGEPAPEERRKSLQAKRVKLVEKCADGNYSGSGSAPTQCIPKPPFAQDEENALYELEHFVQGRPTASQAGLQKFAAERDLQLLDQRPDLARRTADRSRRGMNDRHAVHVFPSAGATPAAACRAYPIRAISMSAFERALPLAAADR